MSTEAVEDSSAKQKRVLRIGALFIFLGILFNEWVVGRWLSLEGVIESPATKLLIRSLQLVTMLFGAGVEHPRLRLRETP